MGRRAKAAYAEVEKVLGLPEPLWQELFEEVERLKALYLRLKEAPREERVALEEEALRSLAHLWGHAKVMWDELELEEEG
ncbi:hypothetical protein QT17_09205 [Thermus sp. 2.9]|uniref:hypothetical protein n=1 Tax=Thermus sp. (strain 2.9) TaxID=1577051 RepID=UPI000543CFED|nr:hypothetical protein [Thermus sp. 2.9]KHG65046.1 hypothetical protein QT17_09205 [Thermus sp. 2.9]